MASPAPGDFSGLCREHRALLSVFCLDDLQPLCEQCAEEEHSQHRVYLLSEAAGDCKGELSSSLNNLKQRITVTDKVTQNYQQVSQHNQAVAELAEAQIKKEFELLHQMLQKEEADRVLVLKQDKDEKLNKLKEQTKVMDEMVTSLEERIRLTEAELDAGGEGVQFLKDYQVSDKRQCSDLKKPKSSFLMNVAKHLGNLKFSVWNKLKQSALYTPVTLDPRTAGRGLTVPFPLHTAHFSPGAVGQEPLRVPDHPERFRSHSSVLAREGFSSGVHSWDIEVSDCENWTVGVASRSIPRQVQFEACPESGLWCISSRDAQYLSLTTPAQTLPCSASRPLKRIHVRLDWDSGVLEFHDVETDTNIFTFKHRFTETVYPYFEALSGSGSLSLVPNEASVSVTSEGDIVEDCVLESRLIDSSKTDSTGREKKKETKKRTVKKGLVKTQPTVKQTTGKIQFCDEYHVSLFRLHKKKSTDTCNHIKHG